MVLAALLISAATISCTLLRDPTGKGESVKTRKLNASVPAGMESAELDAELAKSSSLRIILPESGLILLGDADARPIALASLDPQLKTIANSTPDRRVVYLIVAGSVPTGEVATILDKVRDFDITIVKLATSSRRPDESDGFFTKIPPPDGTIEVLVRKEVVANRPNPLNLLVTVGADGRPMLNNEPQNDLDDLTLALRDIFKLRAENGVFRESTNEVEATVLIDVARNDSSRNYGELLRMINAIKLAGAHPVVLGDKDNFTQVSVHAEYPRELTVRPPTLQGPASSDPSKTNLPKTISGGVLNGKALELPRPEYPPTARAVRASGAVSVQVLVDRVGNVVSATAVSGHPLLRPAALQAAKSAKFSPTVLAGERVNVTGVITYHFTP